MKPFLLGVLYKGGGHALVVCGSEGVKNGYYKIAICDPNGCPILNEATNEVSNYHTEYSYLMIKTDYSEFHMENNNGLTLYAKKIDSDNFKELKYVTYEDAYSRASSKNTNSCEVVVNVDSSFYATTDAGTYLSYDGENFTGTAEVESATSAVKSDGESGTSWIIKLPDVNKVEFSDISDNIEVDCLFDTDEYMSVSGQDIDSISFEDDKGISVNGSNAAYTTYIAAKDNDNTLVQVTGETTGEVNYGYNGAKIKIEGVNDGSEIIINKITDTGAEELDKTSDLVVSIENDKTNSSGNSASEGNGTGTGKKPGSGSSSGNGNGTGSGSNTNTGNQPNSGTSAPKKGTVLKSGKNSYKVVKKGSAVAFTKTTSKAAAVTAPATVKIGGIRYKVISIADNAFKNNKKIAKVTIGKNVASIGKNAFSGCKKLKAVTIGKNVTILGTGAFKNCTALTKITIPNKVASIGTSAFSGCKKMTSVAVGTGLKKIGKEAFKGCSRLRIIIIKSTKLKSVGKNAFKGIKPTAKIKVHSKKLPKYKRLLKNKGQGKKVKIIKW
ncbi:MAG: leucine-rich repeat domain-containing protein [Eubacterium sp.]|nr:leucine-rich repeat domain-containing protein [Eubacterium sp.]